MTSFWIAALGLTLLAILVLMTGTHSGQPGPKREPATASNLAVRRQQLATLNRELAAGVILPAEHRAAVADIERSALDEAEADHSSGPGPVGSFPVAGRMTCAWLGLAVVAFAIGVYGFLGNLDGLQPQPPAVTEAAPPPATDDGSAQGVSDMLDAMSARMAAQREGTVDAAGWALVARSYAGLQRFDKASEAFARARRLAPDDAQLLADHADVLAMLQGGRLADEPARLVARALQLDPSNAKALALSAVPSATAATATTAAPAFRISGQIRVSAAMAPRIQATDEVFVFAREPGGAGMPIAVARYPAASFPLAFTLDARNIIGAPTRLASLSQVVLGVRVSRTGDATPRTGDPRAESAPVSLNAIGQDILIEGTVP